MSLASWLSVRFFCFFATWSVFLSYWGVWLVSRGFSVENAGLVITSGLVARAVSVAFVFPWVTRSVSLLRLAQVLPWLSTVVALLYLPSDNLAFVIVVSVVFGFVYPMIMPLNETITTVNANAGNVHYGLVRYWGSAGFIVGVLSCSLVSKLWGAESLVAVFVAWCLAMAVAGVVPPRGAMTFPPVAARRQWRALFADRTFVACLLVAALLQGAHAAYYAFGALALRESGLSDVAVGLVLILAVVGELALFRYATALSARLTVRGLFLAAALASVLRWGTLALTTHPVVFVALQVLHALTFAATHLAFAQYVRDHVPQELATTAHGVYAALAMSLATGVLTGVAGALYAASPSMAFLGMALVCLPCFLLQRVLARSADGRERLLA